ncbi:MAG: ion transporter [Saprospiraceae bacterium]
MAEQQKTLRSEIHRIMFLSDRRDEQIFDIILVILILASVITVMLETVERLHVRFAQLFYIIEWAFTIIFTIEYLLRLYSAKNARAYATSFFGIVDLMAILPAYLGLFFIGSQYFMVVRALRLLRIFRIFKLGHFMDEGALILDAMRASRPKITVFLFFVLLLVTMMGSLMYLIEGGENPGFTSIPRSIYWAIVTLTTVGYGDITPVTELGQFISAFVMILGYAVIAVPTGIVTSELMSHSDEGDGRSCPRCGLEGHDLDARFCKQCGERL